MRFYCVIAQLVFNVIYTFYETVESYVESITETPELVNMLRNMSVSDDSEKKFTYDEVMVGFGGEQN